MQDSASQVRSANAAQLASLLVSAERPTPVWGPDELAAVFRHQLSAPVEVDLGGLEPAVSKKVKWLSDASGLLLKSFADLFAHPNPPAELLRLVKDFAKANRDSRESLIPNEIATMLYYLSIGAAMVRRQERITSLTDAQLERGFSWALRQSWIDDLARQLLESAAKSVSSAHDP